jgi:hypothetical protein
MKEEEADVWAAALHAAVESFDPWLPADHAVQFCMRNGSTRDPYLAPVGRRDVRGTPVRSICRYNICNGPLISPENFAFF